MNRKLILTYSLSFLLPVIILLYCIFSLKAFPFGENSFLYWDSEIEYINLFSYLKSTFFTNNNLFYSFAHYGGDDMLCNSAFLSFFNPFNAIFFLFPDEYLNIALELLMIIKVGLCGLTFSYFLNKEIKESYFSILISTSWALSAHSLITIMGNYIFMDVLYLLPLTIAGVSIIIEKNDYRLYLAALLLTTLSNGHMGYVSILFSFIYFIYKITLKNKNEFKKYIPNLKTLLFSSLINTGLCAWFIVPVLNSPSYGKHEFFGILDRLFELRTGIFEIFSKLYTNTLTDEFWSEKTPYLFVGILIILLLILYFFNKSYSKRERIIDGCLTLFFLSSMMINFLFTIFNMGVENPHGTIYRFGFVFIFFILGLSYKEITAIKETKAKDILITLLIFTGATFIIMSKGYEHVNKLFLISDLLYGIIFVFLIYSIKFFKAKFFNLIIIALAILHILNVASNAEFTFKSQKQYTLSPKINTFINYRKLMKKSLGEIYNIDNSFYKIATQETFIENKDRKIYNNSAFLNSYDSITGYSSFGKDAIGKFYYKIGTPVFIYNLLFTYNDNMQLLPVSLLGVKYIISSNPNLRNPYEKIKNIDNKFYIYNNPYAFPLIFTIDNNEKLKEDIYSKYSNIPDFQNNIVKILLNKDLGNIYQYKKVDDLDRTIADLYYKLNYKGNIFTFTEKPNFKNNTYFLINYHESIWQYINEIYLSDKNFKKKLYINDLNLYPLYLGKNIDEINIEYQMTDFFATEPKYLNEIKKINSFLIEENIDTLKKYYEIANKNKFDLRKITSSHLSAELNVKEDNKLLFTTIPYDEGWNIKIDGKKRKPVELFDCMMAIPLYQGDKMLEMKYIPKGFILGLLISIFSLIILIWNLFISYKNKNFKV